MLGKWSEDVDNQSMFTAINSCIRSQEVAAPWRGKGTHPRSLFRVLHVGSWRISHRLSEDPKACRDQEEEQEKQDFESREPQAQQNVHGASDTVETNTTAVETAEIS